MKSPITLTEFEDHLRALWSSYGGGPVAPESLLTQLKNMSTLTGLLFYYTPMIDAGPICVDLLPVNDSRADALACGLPYTTARLQCVPVMRTAKGEYLISMRQQNTE